MSLHGPWNNTARTVTDAMVAAMKRHGYRTPAEVLATLISVRTNQTGVTHTT